MRQYSARVGSEHGFRDADNQGTGKGWIRDVVCSSDGSMLASCSNDHSIVVWKMPSGNKLCNLDDHDHVVETVSFSTCFDVSMKVSR